MTGLKLSEVHDEDVLTPKQVAQAIHMSASFVRKAIANGELPGHKLGPKALLVKGKALKKWLEEKPAPVKANDTNSDDLGVSRTSGQTDNIASTSTSTMVDRAVELVLR